MAFNNFRLQVTLRLLLSFSLAGIGLYVALQTNYWVTPLMFAAFTLVSVINLIRYIEKTNSELTRFFQSIRYEDFTQTYESTHKGQTFEKLHESLNQVLFQFRKLRADKEAHYHFLLTVFEQVNFPLFCFRTDGSIQFANKATERLVGVTFPKHTHVFANVSEQLEAFVNSLAIHSHQTITLNTNGEEVHWSGTAQLLSKQGEELVLASLQDITTELEVQEVEAWQKVIRVLTHEIMNSLTPVISLSNLANTQLEEVIIENTQVEKSVLKEVQENIETVEQRSKGLQRFVQAYRRLNQLPQPNLMRVGVNPLLQRVKKLMTEKSQAAGVSIQLKINSDFELSLDPELIEQVLINLVVNAIQALENQPKPILTLCAFINEQKKKVIEVEDNGSGIDSDTLPHIFIPFYTTKVEGNGIGLSLSKQIMALHGGKIVVHSSRENFTRFLLIF